MQVEAMVNAGRRKNKGALILAGMSLALAGCANRASPPERWWHDFQGGEIAQDRPPPPGADAPFPNYGGFPTGKPAILSASQRSDDTAQLTVARNLALASASATVLPVETPPPAAKPPSQNQAASQTPAQQASSAPASMTTEAATPTAAPSVAASELPVTTIADIDHPPQLAAGPPSPASLPIGGAELTLNPAGNPDRLAIGFTTGSAVVPRTAMPGLIAYAQAHQTRTLLVQGYADQGDSDAALALGWQRAQAVASALRDAGFPAGALRLATHTPDAAPGVGAELSLLN